MHTACFFPDCYLLSVTEGSIWIPCLARFEGVGTHIPLLGENGFFPRNLDREFAWFTISAARLLDLRQGSDEASQKLGYRVEEVWKDLYLGVVSINI